MTHKLIQSCKKIALGGVLGLLLSAGAVTAQTFDEKTSYKPFGDVAFELVRSVAVKNDAVYGALKFNPVQELFPLPSAQQTAPLIVYNNQPGHLLAVEVHKQDDASERYTIYVTHDDKSTSAYHNLSEVSPELIIGQRVRLYQAIGILPFEETLELMHIGADSRAKNQFGNRIGSAFDIVTLSQSANFAQISSVIGNAMRNSVAYVGRPVDGSTNNPTAWENVPDGAALDHIQSRPEDARCRKDTEAAMLAGREARVEAERATREAMNMPPPNVQAAACYDIYQANMAGPIAETFSGPLAGIIANVFPNQISNLWQAQQSTNQARDVVDWANQNVNGQTCDTVNNTLGDIHTAPIPVDALYTQGRNQSGLMAVIAPDIMRGSMTPPISGVYSQSQYPGARTIFDFGATQPALRTTGGVAPQQSNSNYQIPLSGGVTVPYNPGY